MAESVKFRGPRRPPALAAGVARGPRAARQRGSEVRQRRQPAGRRAHRGDRPAGASLEYDCCVAPTIVVVDTKHSLWREEMFGPVVARREARGLDDAAKGSPGLRCYPRVKTAAVRFAW